MTCPKANKYVLTRGSAKLDWANSHKMRNIDDLRKVKAGDGPDIVLWGSSTLYPRLLEANLIDRFLLPKSFLPFPRTIGQVSSIMATYELKG